MTKFNIQDRETGHVIDTFSDYDQAVLMLEQYERQDKANGLYLEDFYEISEYCQEEIKGIEDLENERQDV
jgi:hypothetical protein